MKAADIARPAGLPKGVAALTLVVCLTVTALLPLAGRVLGPHGAFLPAFFSAVAGPIATTASIGVAQVERGGDLAGAIAAADQALYAAKNAGRNRVAVIGLGVIPPQRRTVASRDAALVER